MWLGRMQVASLMKNERTLLLATYGCQPFTDGPGGSFQLLDLDSSLLRGGLFQNNRPTEPAGLGLGTGSSSLSRLIILQQSCNSHQDWICKVSREENACAAAMLAMPTLQLFKVPSTYQQTYAYQAPALKSQQPSGPEDLPMHLSNGILHGSALWAWQHICTLGLFEHDGGRSAF